MATVTKTIGTSGRDYSTLQAWEDDLDDGTNAANDTTAYSSSDDAVGEVYNDSTFDELCTINGGGTVGLSSITLRGATGERHDGTAGTGARIVASTNARGIIVAGTITTTVAWLELDGGGFLQGSSTTGMLDADQAQVVYFANCLVHDTTNTGTNFQVFSRLGSFSVQHFINLICYDHAETGTSTGRALCLIGSAVGGRDTEIINCTVYKVTNDGGSGDAIGISVGDDTGSGIRNCISMGMTGTSSGTKTAFSPSFSNAYCDHNMSDDTSASGTGSLTSKVVADQFVSTTDGAEDLHLKSGADAIDAGSDVGTSPTGVNIDIDGRDRDAEGDVWDIGADEYVSAGTDVTITPSALNITSEVKTPSGEVRKFPSVLAVNFYCGEGDGLPNVPVVMFHGTTLDIGVDLLSPTVDAAGNKTVSPSTLTITAAVQTPSKEVRVSPDSLTLLAQLLGPGYTILVVPDVLDVETSVLSPSINTGSGVTVTPSTLQIVSQVLSPGKKVDITPSLLDVTVGLQSPGLTVDAIVTPSVLNIAMALLAPSVAASGNVTITPSALNIAAAVQAPGKYVSIAPQVQEIVSEVLSPSLVIDKIVSVSTLEIVCSVKAPGIDAGGVYVRLRGPRIHDLIKQTLEVE